MYGKGHDEKELALFGLKPEDFATDDVQLFPENYLSFQIFNAMGTQWRVGMNGATGLDYNVLSELWRRFKVPPKDRDYLFFDIQVMEHAALSQMRENQAAN